MFCCHAFKNLIENAGERGLAVLVSEHPEGLRFALQMRAVAFADAAAFSQGPLPATPTNISLSDSMRIRFCPSCGKRLDELVAQNIKLLKELAVNLLCKQR